MGNIYYICDVSMQIIFYRSSKDSFILSIKPFFFSGLGDVLAPPSLVREPPVTSSNLRSSSFASLDRLVGVETINVT